MEEISPGKAPRLDARREQRLTKEQRAVSDAFLLEELPRRKWYHRMDLGNGLVTPGFNWENVWSNARQVRNTVDYRDKAVLDLASWDGLWAFEAEALGAAMVVATDCVNTWHTSAHQGMNNLILVRETLFSESFRFGMFRPRACGSDSTTCSIRILF